MDDLSSILLALSGRLGIQDPQRESIEHMLRELNITAQVLYTATEGSIDLLKSELERLFEKKDILVACILAELKLCSTYYALGLDSRSFSYTNYGFQLLDYNENKGQVFRSLLSFMRIIAKIEKKTLYSDISHNVSKMSSWTLNAKIGVSFAGPSASGDSSFKHTTTTQNNQEVITKAEFNINKMVDLDFRQVGNYSF
jgi:hypothetical protein